MQQLEIQPEYLCHEAGHQGRVLSSAFRQAPTTSPVAPAGIATTSGYLSAGPERRFCTPPETFASTRYVRTAVWAASGVLAVLLVSATASCCSACAGVVSLLFGAARVSSMRALDAVSSLFRLRFAVTKVSRHGSTAKPMP